MVLGKSLSFGEKCLRREYDKIGYRSGVYILVSNLPYDVWGVGILPRACQKVIGLALSVECLCGKRVCASTLCGLYTIGEGAFGRSCKYDTILGQPRDLI